MPPLSTFPLIPEIIQLICDELFSAKPALASLARTSKMFKESALNVLWSEIVEFYPLAKCLPPDTWMEEDKVPGEKGQNLILLRALTPDDCSHYLYYARKVRHFKADYMELLMEVQNVVDTRFFEALQFALNGGKLLPNIRHLSWSFQDNLLSFLRMLTGPPLEKFSLEFSPSLDDPMYPSVIMGLHKQNPQLKEISFTFYIYPEVGTRHAEYRTKAIGVISSAVCMWNDVQSLAVQSLTYSALVAVSQLPSLATFEICDCDIEPSSTQPGISAGGFPSLHTLVLSKCASASACCAVLELLECSPVHTVRLAFKKALDAVDWKQVFLMVNQHCRHGLLTTLDCKDDSVGYRTTVTKVPSRDINEDIIKPLLAFQNLTFLNFEAVRGFDIAEADAIEKMATSWRKIRTLNIKQPPFFRVRQRHLQLCISDLVPFAEYCPDLKGLRLVFDATSLESVIGTNFTSKSRLSQICVSASPVDNPDTVAASLSAIFPSLKKIRTVADIEGERYIPRRSEKAWGNDHMAWKRIEQLLKDRHC